MKTPKFWKEKNFISYSLLPLSYLYSAIKYIRNLFIKTQKINKPVICIGNIIAGGAGKTPIAIELGRLLNEKDISFAYLSRGYGGNIEDFTLVRNKDHKFHQVGDEPLLLSQISTTFISKNRLFGAAQIAKMPDKKLIIMDDGLQNAALEKDLSILVIDGGYGFGNGLLMPSGPLREDIDSGVAKADIVVIIGKDQFDVAQLCKGKKVIFANIKTTNSDIFIDKKVIAFCGIGRPKKFFDSLEESNCKIIKTISYSDHYQYKDSDLDNMILLAQKEEALLVTTKKDWVRLKPQYKTQIDYLDIKIEFDDELYLLQRVMDCIS